jgi:hypothetical protein
MHPRGRLQIYTGNPGAGHGGYQGRDVVPQQLPLFAVQMVTLLGRYRAGDPGIDRTHAVGTRIGKALQQQGIHQRKNCRVCADGKRQGQDDGHGKSRIAPELPQSIVDILPEKLQANAGAMIADRLLYLLDAAEVRHCGTASFGGRHSSGDPFLRHQIHVGVQFLVELAFHLLLAKEIARAALE